MSTTDVERYLRLAEHDLTVLDLLSQAAAGAKSNADVSDWKVTLLFYVACILVKALGRERGLELNDHFFVKQWLNTTADLVTITRSYRKLEDRSRDARYEGVLFDEKRLRQTLGWFL